MKIVKVEAGEYRTEDGKFKIQKEYTSANGGMKLVGCYRVYKSGYQWCTCKTLAEAKQEVQLYYV